MSYNSQLFLSVPSISASARMNRARSPPRISEYSDDDDDASSHGSLGVLVVPVITQTAPSQFNLSATGGDMPSDTPGAGAAASDPTADRSASQTSSDGFTTSLPVPKVTSADESSEGSELSEVSELFVSSEDVRNGGMGASAATSPQPPLFFGQRRDTPVQFADRTPAGIPNAFRSRSRTSGGTGFASSRHAASLPRSTRNPSVDFVNPPMPLPARRRQHSPNGGAAGGKRNSRDLPINVSRAINHITAKSNVLLNEPETVPLDVAEEDFVDAESQASIPTTDQSDSIHNSRPAMLRCQSTNSARATRRTATGRAMQSNAIITTDPACMQSRADVNGRAILPKVHESAAGHTKSSSHFQLLAESIRSLAAQSIKAKPDPQHPWLSQPLAQHQQQQAHSSLSHSQVHSQLQAQVSSLSTPPAQISAVSITSNLSNSSRLPSVQASSLELAELAPEPPAPAKPSAYQVIREWIRYHYYRVFDDPHAKEWRVWDSLMRVIDLYYLIIIPVAFAWMCEFGGNFLYHFAFFDILCVLRVLFHLGRAKVNEYGQLVIAPKSKRGLYLRRMNGWYEVIGAIPFDWVVMVSAWVYSPETTTMHCFNPHYYGRGNVEMSAEQARLSLGQLDVRYTYIMDDIPTFFMIYSILRFVRLVGTMGTIMWILRSSFSFLGTTAARLAKNLLICVFITHLNACAWWFMSMTVSESQRWITSQYVVRSKQGFLTTWIHRYITTFLASQRAMFFVTRETESLTESAYQIVENLFAACTFGSIIGNLSQIVRSLDTQATLDKVAKVRNVRRHFLAKYMIKNSFPPELQRKVLDHEEFDWIHKRGMDTEDTFHQLPRSLFLEVSVHLYFELVSKVPIFSATSDVFRVTLCEKMSMISVRKGFYVCKAGDQGSEMFFIRSGSVEVLSADESKVFVNLKPGGFFGEVALFKECRRTATVRTTSDTVLCVLRKSDFNAILDNNPSVREEFRVLIQKREEDDAKRKQQEEEEKARKEAEEKANAAKAAAKELHRLQQEAGSKQNKSKGGLLSTVMLPANHISKKTAASGMVLSRSLAKSSKSVVAGETESKADHERPAGSSGKWSRKGSASGAASIVTSHLAPVLLMLEREQGLSPGNKSSTSSAQSVALSSPSIQIGLPSLNRGTPISEPVEEEGESEFGSSGTAHTLIDDGNHGGPTGGGVADIASMTAGTKDSRKGGQDKDAGK